MVKTEIRLVNSSKQKRRLVDLIIFEMQNKLLEKVWLDRTGVARHVSLRTGFRFSKISHTSLSRLASIQFRNIFEVFFLSCHSIFDTGPNRPVKVLAGNDF